jgi:two-component system LytT family sensor kinase
MLHAEKDLMDRVAEPGHRRFWLETAIIFAAWTVFGLILATQLYMQGTLGGRPQPWPAALKSGLINSTLWAVETVAIFWLARRVPLARKQLFSRIAVHIIAAIALSFARTAFMIQVLGPRPFGIVFWGSVSVNILYYALLLGIAHAMLYYGRYREGERTAERLAAGLTEARLQALKMQLQPHFLFNTLNAISALIPAEAQPARRMVARLGDLLRIALEHEETQEVTLREELAFLQPYLEIEQARLKDRLTVTMEIAPETLDARVPHLLLQPLVENSIRHGVAPRIDPGSVTISTALTPDHHMLHLEVRDDGPGVERNNQARTRKGVGLANIQSRLEQLYGREHRFVLENHPEGGVVVRISLPFRAAGVTDGRNEAA